MQGSPTEMIYSVPEHKTTWGREGRRRGAERGDVRKGWATSHQEITYTHLCVSPVSPWLRVKTWCGSFSHAPPTLSIILAPGVFLMHRAAMYVNYSPRCFCMFHLYPHCHMQLCWRPDSWKKKSFPNHGLDASNPPWQDGGKEVISYTCPHRLPCLFLHWEQSDLLTTWLIKVNYSSLLTLHAEVLNLGNKLQFLTRNSLVDLDSSWQPRGK